MAHATEIVAQLRRRPADVSPHVATGEPVERSVEQLMEALRHIDGVVVAGDPYSKMEPTKTIIEAILRPRHIPPVNVGKTTLVTAPDEPLYNLDDMALFLRYMTSAVNGQLPHLGMRSHKPRSDLIE